MTAPSQAPKRTLWVCAVCEERCLFHAGIPLKACSKCGTHWWAPARLVEEEPEDE